MTAASSSTSGSALALPIYTSLIELPLYLSPAVLAQPMEGVREQLSRSVLRYVERLDGVLLSYAKLRLKQPLGRIAYDAPEVHIRVEFEATYFAPRPGDVLEASVSRIGGDHVALLVLGMFNGSVGLPHDWSAAAPSLQPDDTVRFVVRSVHHSNGLIAMHGDLQSEAERAEAEETRAKAAAERAHAASAATAAASAASAAAAAAAATPDGGARSAADGDAAGGGSGKRKRTPEEKEERKKKKADKKDKKDKKDKRRDS